MEVGHDITRESATKHSMGVRFYFMQFYFIGEYSQIHKVALIITILDPMVHYFRYS